MIGNGEEKNDNDVVAGTFYIKNKPASLLFDSGADLSYVSLSFSKFLDSTLTLLEHKHAVELADGKLIEATRIHRGCKLDLASQIFDVNLIPVVLGSCWHGLVVQTSS